MSSTHLQSRLWAWARAQLFSAQLTHQSLNQPTNQPTNQPSRATYRTQPAAPGPVWWSQVSWQTQAGHRCQASHWGNLPQRKVGPHRWHGGRRMEKKAKGEKKSRLACSADRNKTQQRDRGWDYSTGGNKGLRRKFTEGREKHYCRD